MLSIEQCRKLLGHREELSETDIERLRDGLYALADVIATTFAERRQNFRQQAGKLPSTSVVAGTAANDKANAGDRAGRME